MKKYCFFSLLFFTVFNINTTAQKSSYISLEEAQFIADDFFSVYSLQEITTTNRANIRSSGHLSTLAYKYEDNEQQTSFYVFNSPSDGFVIVSGYRENTPIVGYSLNSSFDVNKIPDNMQWWLQQYSKSETINTERQDLNKRSSIEPLIATKWNQYKPFNNYIPTDNNTNYPTGCNPTAVSQIMKYYEYPKRGVGNNQYYYNGQTFQADFEHTEYDWDNMLNDYSKNYDQVEADAVAELMYHVGVAANTKYDRYGSSAAHRDMATALIKFFDYDKSIEYVQREYFNDAEWDEIIYNELCNSRPVIYSGSNGSAGHSFIIHGYDSKNKLYAINWGWGGYCDGYYSLNGYNPLSPNEISNLNKAPSRNNTVTIDKKNANSNIVKAYSSEDVPLIYDNNCDKAPDLKYTLTDKNESVKDLKGVCADGVSQVVIRLDKGTYLPPSDCGFEYKWDEIDEKYGSLSATDCPDKIVYTAPEEFPGKENDWSYPIKATIHYSNGDPDYDGSVDVDIDIIRVPVVMIHGLNANMTTWLKLHWKLLDKGLYKEFQTKLIDYSSTNCSHFSTNIIQIQNGINVAIKNCLKEKYVASKCDLVGHSMGGILARLHVQYNNGAKNVNKIITVNTPHSGSSLGDVVHFLQFIEDLTDNINIIHSFIKRKIQPISNTDFLLQLLSFNSTEAINDLALNSEAIDKYLNLEPALNKMNNIPIHAIETKKYFTPHILEQLDKKKDNPLIQFMIFFYNLGYFKEENENRGSDLIVTVESQRGGLQEPHYSHYNDIWHLAAPDEPIVIERIITLLTKPKKDNLFSKSGFHPTNLSWPITTSNRTIARTKELTLQDTIVYLSRDKDSIYIKAETHNDSTKYSAIISFGNVNTYSFNIHSFSCPIPSYFEGIASILYSMCKEGEDPTFFMDTLNIENARTYLKTFSVNVDDMLEDDIQHISAHNIWEDGSESEDVPERMTGGKDVVLYEDGILTANKPGTVDVTFYLKEHTYNCSITVTPRGVLIPITENDLYHGNNTDSPGYNIGQSIIFNIKPNEGGTYKTIIASKSLTSLNDNNYTSLKTVQINRTTDDDLDLELHFQPYNIGLRAEKFIYGVMLRNVINGLYVCKKGGSTDNLSNKELGSYHYYSGNQTTFFSTSLLQTNGIYEVLPSYSVDEGQTWIPMLRLSDDTAPNIIIKGSNAPVPISLPIIINEEVISVGKTTAIQYNPFFNGTILFSSSNPDVVEVTPSGLLTGLKEGKSTISISITGDENFIDETKRLEITVIEHTQKPLILDVTNNKLTPGDYSEIVVENDFDGKISYQIIPDGMVKITSDGRITPLSDGIVTIIASSTETYDYYPTVNALTIDIDYDKLDISNDLCISKKPIIGTDNVISEGDSKLNFYVYNNTDQTIYNAIIAFKVSQDNGYYTYRYWKRDFAPETGFNAIFDLLELKDQFTPGKDYFCYFYKDINFSEPLNIPVITFRYGKEENISFDLDVCSTISLPFDSEIPMGMHVYEIIACYNNTLVLNEVHNIQRNHSYIVCGDSKQYIFTGIPIPVYDNPRYGFMTGIHSDQVVPKGKYVTYYQTTPLLLKLEETEKRPLYSAYISLPENMPEEIILSQIKWKPNSVDIIKQNLNSKSIGIYSIDGKPLLNFEKGMNILKKEDGSILKILIK